MAPFDVLLMGGSSSWPAVAGLVVTPAGGGVLGVFGARKRVLLLAGGIVAVCVLALVLGLLLPGSGLLPGYLLTAGLSILLPACTLSLLGRSPQLPSPAWRWRLLAAGGTAACCGQGLVFGARLVQALYRVGCMWLPTPCPLNVEAWEAKMTLQLAVRSPVAWLVAAVFSVSWGLLAAALVDQPLPRQRHLRLVTDRDAEGVHR